MIGYKRTPHNAFYLFLGQLPPGGDAAVWDASDRSAKKDRLARMAGAAHTQWQHSDYYNPRTDMKRRPPPTEPCLSGTYLPNVARPAAACPPHPSHLKSVLEHLKPVRIFSIPPRPSANPHYVLFQCVVLWCEQQSTFFPQRFGPSPPAVPVMSLPVGVHYVSSAPHKLVEGAGGVQQWVAFSSVGTDRVYVV